MILQTLLEMIWPQNLVCQNDHATSFFIEKSLLLLGQWFSNLAAFWNHLETLQVLIPGFHPWDTDLFDLGCSLDFVSFRRSFWSPAKMEEPLLTWPGNGIQEGGQARGLTISIALISTGSSPWGHFLEGSSFTYLRFKSNGAKVKRCQGDNWNKACETPLKNVSNKLYNWGTMIINQNFDLHEPHKTKVVIHMIWTASKIILHNKKNYSKYVNFYSGDLSSPPLSLAGKWI